MTETERYLDYTRACHFAGITPLPQDMWRRAISKPALRTVDDTQFDYDTEKREGWAYDD